MGMELEPEPGAGPQPGDDLVSRNQFLAALLSSIPSPVFYKDIQGRYLGCNKAFEEMVGASERQIQGRTVHELWPERYAATYQDKDLELFRSGGRQQYEFQLADSHGQVRDVMYIKSVFHGSDGRIAGLVGVMLDITDRKRRERMEVDLREAQKLKAVGQLAAGIAHEINTPAQFVGDNLGFLGDAFRALLDLAAQCRRLAADADDPLLARGLRQAEAAADLPYLESSVPQALAEADDGIRRINAIVDALKEFAQPDRSEKCPADLNRGLRAALEMAQSEYRGPATVVTELAPLPPVLCHPGELNQVFLNLIVNAAQAIAAKQGMDGFPDKIQVTSALDGDQVRIEIADTGTGIPTELRERVFEPFFSTREVGRGMGQGLSVARSIVVDKHQGSLTLESELGKGTRFTIRLPVKP